MSSPMVAGAAVLVLAANKQLSANTVKLTLQFTARSLPDTDALTQGAGVLNAGGAVRLAELINTRTDYDSVWLRQGSMPVSNIDVSGQTIKWSRTIIYGDRYIKPNAARVHMRRWDDDIVVGLRHARQQHRLGQQHRRRQHRVGQRRRQHCLGQPRRRQHRVGQQHRLGQ